MSHASDLVQLLRNRVPMQSCDTCREDSACFVACGRGACSHEGKLMEQAADEIEKLSHGPSMPSDETLGVLYEAFRSRVYYRAPAASLPELYKRYRQAWTDAFPDGANKGAIDG